MQEIVDQSIGERSNDAVTVEQFVQLLMNEMDINVQIPQLDSDGHALNEHFWSNIESAIIRNDVLLDTSKMDDIEVILKQRFSMSVDTENALDYWLKITVFLADLAKCRKDLLYFFAASASFTIIGLLTEAKIATDDDKLNKSLLSCITCIDRMLFQATSANRSTIYMALCYELTVKFLNIIDRKPIFIENCSLNVLRQTLPSKCMGEKTLEIILMFLSSSREHQSKMFEFFMVKENITALEIIISVGKKSKTVQCGIEIIFALIKYGEEHNLAFECNWIKVLTHIFSPRKPIKKLSVKLLIMKFGNASDNCLLLDVAIQVYQSLCKYSEEIRRDFVNIIESHEEDIRNCTKLFTLLERADTIIKFKMVLSFIHTIVDMYESAGPDDYAQHFAFLMDKLFLLMNSIQNHSLKLFLLFRSVDISRFVNICRFRENFLVLQAVLANCFMNSTNYDDALRMTFLLKKCNIEMATLTNVYESIRVSLKSAISIGHRELIKEASIRYLAAENTFNTFENVSQSVKSELLEGLEMCVLIGNDDIIALHLALVAYLLAANYSPHEQTSVALLDRCEGGLREGIMKPGNSQLTGIALSMAFCRLYTAVPALLTDSVLTKIFSVLAGHTIVCSEDDQLLLVDSLWRKLIELYQMRHITHKMSAIPHKLFVLYQKNNILEICIKKFIVTFWNYKEDKDLFGETMQTALYTIKPISKCKKFIDQVFSLIKSQSNEMNSTITFTVVYLILKKDIDNIAMEVLEEMVKYVDTTYLTAELRQFIATNLRAHGADDSATKFVIDRFVNYFTGSTTRRGTKRARSKVSMLAVVRDSLN